MCFKASSSRTSPVGASDLQSTLANKQAHVYLNWDGRLHLLQPQQVSHPVWTGIATRAVTQRAGTCCLVMHSPLGTDKHQGCFGKLALQTERSLLQLKKMGPLFYPISWPSHQKWLRAGIFWNRDNYQLPILAAPSLINNVCNITRKGGTGPLLGH